MVLLRSNVLFLFPFKLLDLPFSRTVLHTALRGGRQRLRRQPWVCQGVLEVCKNRFKSHSRRKMFEFDTFESNSEQDGQPQILFQIFATRHRDFLW